MTVSFNKNKQLSFLFLLIGILFALPLNAQTANTEQGGERIYMKIEIKGLACPYCAYGMEKELKKVSGVDKVDIELKTGLAYISTPIAQKPSAESLKKIIVDSGFTAGEIVYQSEPFKEEE